MLLGKGDAAGGHAGLLLHLQLARQLPAPHGLDKPAVLGLEGLGLLQGVGLEDVLLQVLLGPLVQAVVDGIQRWRGRSVSNSSRLMKTFSPLSRRTRTHWFFSMSLGPISTRRGTPFISYSAAFQPMDWSEESILARMPAAFSRSSRALAASRTPSLCWATGMTMA